MHGSEYSECLFMISFFSPCYCPLLNLLLIYMAVACRLSFACLCFTWTKRHKAGAVRVNRSPLIFNVTQRAVAVSESSTFKFHKTVMAAIAPESDLFHLSKSFKLIATVDSLFSFLSFFLPIRHQTHGLISKLIYKPN